MRALQAIMPRLGFGPDAVRGAMRDGKRQMWIQIDAYRSLVANLQGALKVTNADISQAPPLPRAWTLEDAVNRPLDVLRDYPALEADGEALFPLVGNYGVALWNAMSNAGYPGMSIWDGVRPLAGNELMAAWEALADLYRRMKLPVSIDEVRDVYTMQLRMSTAALRESIRLLALDVDAKEAAVSENLFEHAMPFVAVPVPHEKQLVSCAGCGTTTPTTVVLANGSRAPSGWYARKQDGLLNCEDCLEHGHGSVRTKFAREHLVVEVREDGIAFVERGPSGERVFKEAVYEVEDLGKAAVEAARVIEERSRKMGQKEKKTLKDQAFDLGGAAGLGVAMAATNQSGEVLIDIAKVLFKNSPLLAAGLEDPLVREIVKMTMATILYGAAENAPNLIPKAAAISNVAKLQVSWSTAQITNEQLAAIRPLLLKLADIGESLPPALTDGSERRSAAEEIEEEEDVRVRVPAARSR